MLTLTQYFIVDNFHAATQVIFLSLQSAFFSLVIWILIVHIFVKPSVKDAKSHVFSSSHF